MIQMTEIQITDIPKSADIDSFIQKATKISPFLCYAVTFVKTESSLTLVIRKPKFTFTDVLSTKQSLLTAPVSYFF